MGVRIEIPSEGRAIPSSGERTNLEPSRDEVARKAYKHWLRRHGKEGSPEEELAKSGGRTAAQIKPK